MDELIERLRAFEGSDELGNGDFSLLSEAAAALEAAQMGLRYAVRVWVLSDEIEWSEAEIDKAVERIIDGAKKEADRE